MWARLGCRDSSLLHDALCDRLGLVLFSVPAQMSCAVAPGPTSKGSSNRHRLPTAFPNSAGSSEGSISILWYQQVRPQAHSHPQRETPLLLGRRVSEKLQPGFQTAAVGHAHVRSFTCTLVPFGDAERQL